MVKDIYSNGPKNDFVQNPFQELSRRSKTLHLASPYFNASDLLLEVVKSGKHIELLVGLNQATCPEALDSIHNNPNISVRYFTRRFHAKIFLFDDGALLGSSNLTKGGMTDNREATIYLKNTMDSDRIEELRCLFLEWWDSAEVLTPEKLSAFKEVHKQIMQSQSKMIDTVENSVGKSEPENISINSRKKRKDRMFVQNLQRLIYEQYKPSFNEVTEVLGKFGYSRPELSEIGIANQTSRFLNYISMEHRSDDDDLENHPFLNKEERQKKIIQYGKEWVNALDNKVPDDYLERMSKIKAVFGDPIALQQSDKEKFDGALRSLYAFEEQLRYVKGGREELIPFFWSHNNNDFEHTKESLDFYLHGRGDFIDRLHDLLYDKNKKISYFGKFCALELYGDINPDECPPITGRIVKTLRFLGYNVKI